MATTYPEHGTGRSAPLATCGHCHGKPLIIRRCPRDSNPATFCGVCQKCGHHHEVTRADLPTRMAQAQALLETRQIGALVSEVRQVKAIVGRIESAEAEGTRKRPPKRA
jgi:hypothetical protein